MPDPGLTREELIEHLQALHSRLTELEHLQPEVKWLEGALRKRTWLLSERMKELETGFALLKLCRQTGTFWEERVQAAVDRLPAGFQHKDAGVRVTVDGKEFRSHGYHDGAQRLTTAVRAAGKPVGVIEVVYRKMHPPSEHGPFLREETALLDVAAECIGILLDLR